MPQPMTELAVKHRGRPLAFNSVEELSTKIEAYFMKQDKLNKPYLITGLAYDLDVDRKTLLNYSKNADYFPTISRARQRIAIWTEEQLFDKTKTRGSMFSLKNNFGWEDKQAIEQKTEVSLKATEEMSDDDLLKIANT